MEKLLWQASEKRRKQSNLVKYHSYLKKSYSIKDIEKYYDFKREGEILKGDVSEEFYIRWSQNKDQKLLDKI